MASEETEVAAAHLASAGAPGSSPAGKGRAKILIVEDNRDMRDFLRRFLARRGYTLLEANDGAEAIALTRDQRPNLVLMDLSLPGMDGLEATRQIKADPELRHIPVIAVTARARSTDQVQAREAGCDDYISKPYSLQDFLRILDAYSDPA